MKDKKSKNSPYTSLQGGWLLWCCHRIFLIPCALPCPSTLWLRCVHVIIFWLGVMTAFNIFRYAAVFHFLLIVRHWLISFLIARHRLVWFIRFSPSAGVTSWVRHRYDCGRAVVFGDSLNLHVNFLYVIHSRHIFSSFFTVRHLLWMMFCCTALIAYTILGYVTQKNIIPVRHWNRRCILLYVMLNYFIHLRHWLLAMVVIASLYNLLLYGAYSTYNIIVRHAQ